MRVICLDTETTGLDKEKDSVIDVCIRDVDGSDEFYIRMRPCCSISEVAVQTHGITEEMVRDSPHFATCADDIRLQIESANVIIGYNPDFDIEMLKTEFKRIGMEVRWPDIVICLKRLWDKHEPPPSRHLQAAYQRFVSIEGFQGAHDCKNDVNATIQVLRGIFNEFQLGTIPWEQLDPQRASWVGASNHFVWVDETKTAIKVNFGKHKDKTFMQLDGWYLNFLQEKDFAPHVKRLASYAQGLRKQGRGTDLNLATWAKENL